ncbi:uncharacterized protein MYCFIDRAFT_216342 [Pseudocercospora fijiensis CIRAD86]|uniref:SET domain-containing protein n=1 Tax=Pseudocercospora fijiensis (strain CIRAD86) TaxID=383855 RepID=M2ZJ69_PSEFD|nr:uncharacterized protein MYCFIDRAFT_216342 [Pseudocercospora fijiensis CIRAD86]EME79144.1 hypothetical protein MYCFIDRAFT_216342 [Pseudocercospora fijiensis CIRAD86]
MTDASLPVKAINAHDLSHHASLSALHAVPNHHQRFAAPSHDNDLPDDDGQIDCICGFADDDGWTVACDICNRWQHQSCYYPEYDEISLPSNVEHYCVKCKPRSIDLHRAHSRQLEKRDQTEPLQNGVKRAPPKSHKKKVKENGVAHTNGWPVDKLRHDRNSASPRDQPPPAKRPKTSHRNSDSTTTTTTTKTHSRKRNASTAHRRSISLSPDFPIEQYSESFLQCYQEDNWEVTDTNLHSSISVTNALSDWLNSSDEEFRSRHGQPKGELLMRWDGHLDEIPGKAQIDIQDQHDADVAYDGRHPSWRVVTVQEPVANGAYIGELKGHVGFKADYQQEEGNRWRQLRHPEPFVFFHPKLPIVIDARHEGTELRYVRRSCQPNARLQILVTDGVDCHFCFMATEQIEPGDEIAVGWDTSSGLPEMVNQGKISEEDMDHLSSWVSTALANCGPCACALPKGDCMMSRFDKRTHGAAEAVKAPKPKKRKTGQHISPINTNTVNSRSGSEARRVDHDDETDSPSASGSAGRGSASRDMTPNTHYSTNGTSTLPELSEREKKKLAKEEEMFRRQEEERAGKQAKKKRSSAGSNLNTPSATSSKQLGFPDKSSTKSADAGSSRQHAASNAKAPVGRKPKSSKLHAKPAAKATKRPKPDYREASTQCDLDQEEAAQRAPTPSSRRPFKSHRKRLLERCARNNSILLASVPPSPAFEPKAALLDKMDVDQSELQRAKQSTPDPTAASVKSPLSKATDASTASNADHDAEMADAPSDVKVESPVAGHSTAGDSPGSTRDSHPDKPSPAPPWDSKPSTADTAINGLTQKPMGMRLQMPPPPTNPFALPPMPGSAGSPNTASISQSPAGVGPGQLFSPSVTAAVTPSPARKKMSLSDYTRRKKKDDGPKVERDSSPASTASGPIVAPLQPSSSSEVRAAEGNAVEEDVKMEEAPQVENVPPSTAA